MGVVLDNHKSNKKHHCKYLSFRATQKKNQKMAKNNNQQKKHIPQWVEPLGN